MCYSEEIKKLFIDAVAGFCDRGVRYDDDHAEFTTTIDDDVVRITATCSDDKGIIIASSNNEVEAVYRFNFEARVCIMDRDIRFTDPESPHLASSMLTDILGPLLNDDKLFTWLNRPVRVDLTVNARPIKELNLATMLREMEEDDNE